MSDKRYIWTRADMHIDDVTKFINDRALQPGEFQLAPFAGGDMITVVYLAAML